MSIYASVEFLDSGVLDHSPAIICEGNQRWWSNIGRDGGAQLRDGVGNGSAVGRGCGS
jgi:hypothetical protein